jgi:hypothetical protein
MEQREKNVELKAMALVAEFIKKFRSMDFTLHPSDIPGESAGKGSNVAWAARKLSERYPLETRKNVLITGIDGTFARFGPRPLRMPCYNSSRGLYCSNVR